jgi:hypothetical protein
MQPSVPLKVRALWRWLTHKPLILRLIETFLIRGITICICALVAYGIYRIDHGIKFTFLTTVFVTVVICGFIGGKLLFLNKQHLRSYLWFMLILSTWVVLIAGGWIFWAYEQYRVPTAL